MIDYDKEKQVAEWFGKHGDDEFLEFDRIPVADRRHSRPDLCAFLYLHEKLGGDGDVIGGAGHDEIWLGFGPVGELTEEDVIYLSRCGVRCDENGLCMFV